jgi:hypothetical protein
MQTDRFTRACLGVIALSLAVLAFQPMVPTAHAAEDIRCSFDGPLEIKRINGTVKVEVDSAFSSPGSSSSSPLHVQTHP